MANKKFAIFMYQKLIQINTYTVASVNQIRVDNVIQSDNTLNGYIVFFCNGG